MWHRRTLNVPCSICVYAWEIVYTCIRHTLYNLHIHKNKVNAYNSAVLIIYSFGNGRCVILFQSLEGHYPIWTYDISINVQGKQKCLLYQWTWLFKHENRIEATNNVSIKILINFLCVLRSHVWIIFNIMRTNIPVKPWWISFLDKYAQEISNFEKQFILVFDKKQDYSEL